MSRPKRRIGRRSVRSLATVEQYLRAGVVPRFVERANQIEEQTRRHRQRLERAYVWAQEEHAGDPEAFAEHWMRIAMSWRFDDVNDLIDEHNRWYPAERRLPMNPRTGDYVPVGGRSYRRPVLGPEWVLEQFPAMPAD